MLEIVKRYGPIRIYQKWFYEEPNIYDRYSFTVYKQTSSLIPYKGFIRKDFYTLHIGLDTKTTDELFKNFSKTNQTKIKKALKEEMFFSSSLDFFSFVDFFNTFARFKKLSPLSVRGLFFYGENILFTWITDKEGPIASHAYIMDREKLLVRLLYSATRVRNSAEADYISRSNRRLHWHDICYFKEQGFKIYDFGGLALKPGNKETEGIDFFKQSFGGEIVHQSHYESIPAFVLKKLLRKD